MSLFRLLGFKQEKKNIDKINVSQAFDYIKAGSHLLIDVRQQEEWQNTGRPQGSHGVTLQAANFVDIIEELIGGDKSAPIALSCRSGKRSLAGATKLVNAGFTNVSNVEGGFIDWNNQGLPIDKPPFSN